MDSLSHYVVDWNQTTVISSIVGYKKVRGQEDAIFRQTAENFLQRCSKWVLKSLILPLNFSNIADFYFLVPIFVFLEENFSKFRGGGSRSSAPCHDATDCNV